MEMAGLYTFCPEYFDCGLIPVYHIYGIVMVLHHSLLECTALALLYRVTSIFVQSSPKTQLTDRLRDRIIIIFLIFSVREIN